MEKIKLLETVFIILVTIQKTSLQSALTARQCIIYNICIKSVWIRTIFRCLDNKVLFKMKILETVGKGGGTREKNDISRKDDKEKDHK